MNMKAHKSLPCDHGHNKPISQFCDLYKILIQMSVKVTLWLFKAVLHSHLAALYPSPFPIWLSFPVNIQTEQAASTLPCSRIAMSDRGRSGALLGRASPGTGHTSIPGSWVDKAMCIWDGESIGGSIRSPCLKKSISCGAGQQFSGCELAKGSFGLCPCKCKCKCCEVSGDSLNVRQFHFIEGTGLDTCHGAGLLDLPRAGERGLLLVWLPCNPE